MLFLVHLVDRENSADLRATHLHDHMEWLAAHADTLLVAGLMQPEPDAPHVGAIWIVKAPSREAVLAMADTDPFWLNGVRRSREVYYYGVRTALPVVVDR
jgi:uncharacterized protein YciI